MITTIIRRLRFMAILIAAFFVTLLWLVLGLDKEEIVRMVSQRGGSKNLAAVVEQERALRESGFHMEQIVRISKWQKFVSNDGTSGMTYFKKKYFTK